MGIGDLQIIVSLLWGYFFTQKTKKFNTKYQGTLIFFGERYKIKPGDTMERAELLRTLEQCGHFLYHRRGKRIGQYRILIILFREGKIPQRELQERLRIKSGSVSEIILKMEGFGYIRRTKDEADKRRILLELTELGMAKVKEALAENEREETLLFNSLTDEECEDLYGLLTKVYQGWKECYEEDLFGHGCGKRK